MIKHEVNALSRSWQACLMMMESGLFVMLPEWAWAQSTSTSNSGLPMEDVFCTMCQWLTGPVGRAIATICMAISGLGAIMGKISWGMATLVGANVATVFGAAVVVDALAGGAAINQCDASILNQASASNLYTPNFWRWIAANYPYSTGPDGAPTTYTPGPGVPGGPTTSFR